MSRLRFPVGYFALPVMFLALASAIYAGITITSPRDDAPHGNDAVDPGFLRGDDSDLSPQGRLDRAALHVRGASTDVFAVDFRESEFFNAMAWHTYVDKVFTARYASKVVKEDRHRMDQGLRVFREHYKAAAERSCDIASLVPANVGNAQHAAMVNLLGNAENRANVDRAVAKALRSR